MTEQLQCNKCGYKFSVPCTLGDIDCPRCGIPHADKYVSTNPCDGCSYSEFDMEGGLKCNACLYMKECPQENCFKWRF